MKKNLILTVLIMILAIFWLAGCERHIVLKTPTEPAPEEGPVPTNLKVALGDARIDLSWEAGGTQAISKYRVFLADSLGQQFTLFDSTTTPTISLSGLTLNQKYWFRIAAVFNSGLQGYLSDAVSARYARLNILINSGAEYTNREQVTVLVNASENISHIMLSETNDFSDSLWFPASTQNQYLISSGDGLKTIYAHLIFANGAMTLKPLVDNIILDTYAAIDEVWFMPVTGTKVSGDTINFFVEAGETGGEAKVSFTGSGTIILSDLGTGPDQISGDGTYSGFWVVPYNILLEDEIIYGEFTDAAGNRVSGVAARYRLNINTTPDAIPIDSPMMEKRP